MTIQILRKKHVHLLFFEICIRYHSSNKIERKTNTITNQFLIFRKLYDTKSWKRLLHNNRQNSLIVSNINTNTNPFIIFRRFHDIKSWKRLLHSYRQNSFTASKTTPASFPTNLLQHTLLLRLQLKFYHCYSPSHKRTSIRVTSICYSSIALKHS